MSNTNVIYMHRNLVSGKSYIGLTARTTTERWTEHCYMAYKTDKDGNYISNWKFHKALRKYGLDTWEHLVLHEGGSDMSLEELEIYYIAKYNTYKNGYNSTLGGEGIDSESNRKGKIANRKDSVKGYTWNERQQSYSVQLRYMGKGLNFGYFKDEGDAKAKSDYLFSLSDEELLKAYEEYRLGKNKGYCFDKTKSRYKVYLTVDGKRKSFGYCTTEQDAAERVAQLLSEFLF